jgi:iron complex outermembrane receptor protein
MNAPTFSAKSNALPLRHVGWLQSFLSCGSVSLLLACMANAEPAEPPTIDYSAMSIEDLMQVKLSLSRTDERLVQSPSAAYIITSDEIRRSGATSIPEVLRGVPGVEVARVDPHTWAVTSRGFNDSFANKLLVMIDGRTAYTPLFSGVFWDVQDTLLEDIDHIEVIRGPGSTLWGANAVNGVINVVTKTAAQTQGGLVTAGGGSDEIGFGAIRYGGQIAEDVHYRTYVKYFSREGTEFANGDSAGNWDALRGGFRMDWTPGARKNGSSPDMLTLEGEMYEGRVDQTFTESTLTPPSVRPVHDEQQMDGGHVLGRWTHDFGGEANIQLQTYYDRTHRSLVLFSEQRDTFDIDFQNRFKVGDRNDVIWGAGYRLTSDHIGDRPAVRMVPSSRTLNLFSFFAQDEVVLIERMLRATIGTKVEHNDYTAWEVQPGARLLWTPATNHSVWASVTRAVRTPSRAEEDIRVASVLNSGIPVELQGSHSMESEKLIAYELGYRVQPVRTVSFDAALFYNDYDELRTLDAGPVTPTALIQLAGNRMHGHTDGIELGANWDVQPWWKLRGSYTWLEMHLDAERGSDEFNTFIEKSSPRQQFMVRSSFDLPHDVTFDLAVRYLESLETQNYNSATVRTLHVPSYTSLDARLAWRPIQSLEISIVGQNLLEDHHREFNATTIRGPSVAVERAVYGKVTWQF